MAMRRYLVADVCEVVNDGSGWSPFIVCELDDLSQEEIMTIQVVARKSACERCYVKHCAGRFERTEVGTGTPVSCEVISETELPPEYDTTILALLRRDFERYTANPSLVPRRETFDRWLDLTQDVASTKRYLLEFRGGESEAPPKGGPAVPVAELSTPKRAKGISKDEANVRARVYLKEHAKDHHVTKRELAKGIGCSEGLVFKLPSWQAYQEELRKQDPPAPRAVSLTDGVLANEGRDDEELRRLIGEQAKDDAADRRGRRRRPTV